MRDYKGLILIFIQWKPAMAHTSSEILGLRSRFFKYCIIKKLHDKITTDYTLLLGLCKKHWVKYGFGTISLVSLVVNGKFCFLTSPCLGYNYAWPGASCTTTVLVEIMMLTEKL